MLNPISYITKDLKRIPLGVKLVVLVIFLRTLGWGFADPFYSIFIESFSESYTVVGAFIALMSVISLLTVVPLMRLTDKVKDARIMEDGEFLYLITIILYMLAGFFRSVPFLVAAFIFNGVAHPLVVVGAESYIRKHGGRGGDARSFGFYTALSYTGWILGMVIAAFLVPYYSLNTMFLFVLPSILISFFILPKIKERGIKSLVRGFRRYFHKRQDFVDIFNDCKNLDRKTYFFLILAFFDGMIMMFTFVFIPLLALSLNLAFGKIALIMAVMYLPFIFSFFFSEAADRIKKMSMIAVGLFISAIAFILLSFVIHQLWVVILAAMTSLSLAIIRPAYNGMITSLTPRSILGEVTSLNNLFVKLGHIIGPIFTGYIADLYGIKFTFIIIALIALFLGIATLTLKGVKLLTN
ncbi:MFS transporter [Patescibacteria group bacterium]|nr:MFS transporter [Patescibacteria group bacterium]